LVNCLVPEPTRSRIILTLELAPIQNRFKLCDASQSCCNNSKFNLHDNLDVSVVTYNGVYHCR
jgi:hypothetical protein